MFMFIFNSMTLVINLYSLFLFYVNPNLRITDNPPETPDHKEEINNEECDNMSLYSSHTMDSHSIISSIGLELGKNHA